MNQVGLVKVRCFLQINKAIEFVAWWVGLEFKMIYDYGKYTIKVEIENAI